MDVNVLLDKVSPIVDEFIGPVIEEWNSKYTQLRDGEIKVEYGVQFVEHMQTMKGTRYDFTIQFTGGDLYLDELMSIVGLLQTFWTYENAIMVDDAEYHLGDGDDSLAVQFKDGKFHIWLRSWDKED